VKPEGAPGNRRESANMASMTGGEMIIAYLIREKVPCPFGLCGDGNAGFLDACTGRRCPSFSGGA
jgi:hypothetical protein